MRFYVTKYALTDGIKTLECERSIMSGYVDAEDYYSSFKIGRHAFKDLSDAIEAAEKMRKRKIESLKKQIAKLEGMKFE